VRSYNKKAAFWLLFLWLARVTATESQPNTNQLCVLCVSAVNLAVSGKAQFGKA
jgi:hypothetical protein